MDGLAFQCALFVGVKRFTLSLSLTLLQAWLHLDAFSFLTQWNQPIQEVHSNGQHMTLFGEVIGRRAVCDWEQQRPW